MEDTAGEYRRMYENTAGEIEAWDVTARRQLTPEQRRQTMPNTGTRCSRTRMPFLRGDRHRRAERAADADHSGDKPGG